jgi:hypothetical protein
MEGFSHPSDMAGPPHIEAKTIFSASPGFSPLNPIPRQTGLIPVYRRPSPVGMAFAQAQCMFCSTCLLRCSPWLEVVYPERPAPAAREMPETVAIF